jgi:hypothetical protein
LGFFFFFLFLHEQQQQFANVKNPIYKNCVFLAGSGSVFEISSSFWILQHQ